MTRALRIGSFRRLLASYGLNELTWSFGTIALAVLIYRRTGSALGSTAFFLCSQFAPALFSPLLVARLDGIDHSRILPVLYALEAVLFGVLAAMATHPHLVPILAVTLVDGIIALSARVISRTATVAVLRPLDLLHEGNALINVVFSVCYMIGPAIGGLVVAAGGTVASLLVNCALFSVIALVLAVTTLPVMPLHADDRELTAMRRLRAAITHARHDPAIGWLLLLQTIGMIIFTISIPVEVVFAQHSVHAGAGGYGAMLSGWGAGAVAGSAVYARWRRARGHILLALSGVLLAVGFTVIAAAPTIVVAVVGSALGGAGNGAGGIAIRTMLQEYTPQRWMSLTMSLLESLGQVAPGLGFVLGGVLSSVSNPRVALAVAAVGSLGYAVAVGWALRPARIGEPPPVSPAETPSVPTAGGGHVSGVPAGSS